MNIESEIETNFKAKIICSRDLHYPNYAENAPVPNHNKVILILN